jgi:SagB-type dehydrogenase family enzyme
METEIRYKRSSHIVSYWKADRFLFHNYASREVSGATGVACDVLTFFGEWKSLAELCQFKSTVPAAVLEELIGALVAANLLHCSNMALSPEEQAMAKFDRWNPECGFFHTATKDVRFIDGAITERQLDAQPTQWPMPSPVMRRAVVNSLQLPAPNADGPLAETLKARRTWRRFGGGIIPLSTFATVLGYTAGIQHWVTVPPAAKVALKTSPSGGARHAVEVYTLAWAIGGLPKGLYHYAADTHELELLREGLDQRQVPIYLPFGDYWSDACAVVFFSAVYERDLWRYPYSRAYRAPFIEAGHLCQTFCLMATSLNLAPFCAMALADTAIERDLGIDGISESVLYAAGVGVKPDGVQWAPAPVGFETPLCEPNPHLQGQPANGAAQRAKSRQRPKRR